MKLNSSEVKKVPNKTPAIILQEATRVYSKIARPRRINKVEVSPIDPGIDPKKASLQLY
jgi:hypothetical protein